jgi:hypothetical protein
MTWRTLASTLVVPILCLLGSSCKSHQTSSVAIDLTKLQLQLADQALPNQAEFMPIRSVAALPEAVRARIGGMANPGEEFNVADVINSHLPMQRLVFAGASGSYFLVHYEVGGRGHYYVTALLDQSDQRATALWASVSAEKFASMEEFNQAANTRTLKNQAAEVFCKAKCD